MNIIEQFKTAREVYVSLINEHSDEIIKEIIKELGIKHLGLTCGTIIGYTPAFNDGDVCEHYSQIEVGSIENSVLEDLLEIKDDFEYNNLSHEEVRSIETELGLVDLILEEKEGTNYQFAFTIIDGEITIKTDYFECGY